MSYLYVSHGRSEQVNSFVNIALVRKLKAKAMAQTRMLGMLSASTPPY
ncbi:hypothetical protein H6G89_04675 [Oscillatoria sp. FACHB-1407]|nr:hypothetical protein [Oscillatoria sp. FACHB-1407]MBD2460332.1 hypothetical protein [Oscillatoria sp. FACHB-1407]